VITSSDVIEALSGVRPKGSSLTISEASIDSRQVIPASLFVALVGERVDGHQYLADAFKAGASLALIQKNFESQNQVLDLRQRTLPEDFVTPDKPFCILVEDTMKALQDIAFYWRRKLNLKVIGITGSIGKSTTKDLIAEVLNQRFRTLKSKGNLNNEIGLPLTILSLGLGHQYAVLEMGFYALGEIRLLCNIALPQIGVVTNVGPVHAERSGSLEVTARGKAELVESLPIDGTAILNYDDPLVRAMAKQTKANVFFYGLDPDAHLWADKIESLGLEGIRFRLHYQNETLHLRVPLIGQHSVHTILRATAVGLVEGMTWHDIISGLQMGRSQLRLVAVHTPSGALLLDDSYNSSPESALAALNLLQEMDGKKIAVFGDMLELGPYEKAGHEKVGLRVAQVCQEFVAVGERTKIMIDSAIKAGMREDTIHWFETVPQVIEYLLPYLQKGDTVLVKGSLGMGMSRIVTALESEPS
jgi:UDP-N-acetylmuramoyl-tripeptide--D-alanyl-D-alanine ligase